MKVRLAAKGIQVGKNRVLRLMRAHGLLAPVQAGTSPRRPEPQRPDPDRAAGRAWGTDASRFWTRAEGWCWFFGAVAHCASDVVGWHVAKKGDRWAALEPVRQGVRGHMEVIGAFIERYNNSWLLQRHGYLTPPRAREKLSRRAA